jgi:hypothetical protein
MAAEQMTGKYGDQMEAVFIHRVQPLETTPGVQSLASSMTLWHKRRIFIFDTYVLFCFLSCSS